MKSRMPYWGVPAAPFRAMCKRVFADYPIDDAATWRADALAIWRGANHREERYAAIALTGDKRAKAFQTMASLRMYEEMIVSGAWWDFVDGIASHRLGALLRHEPKPMKKTMRLWSKCDDLWKRRSSILCQLTFKEETDLVLLHDCIIPSIGAPDFFLRKAIGWSLRQLAWTDPKEVVRFVRAHKDELSPLSKREALKNVLKAGIVSKIP